MAGVGFGGSPRMALLMGLTSGVNKAEERERAKQREDILNRQATAQIAESESRIARTAAAEERARRNEVEAAAQAERDAEAAAVEEQETAARMQSIADLVVAANPDITPEQALAIAPNLPAQTVNRLLNPNGDEVDALNPLETARARDVNANADEQEEENRLNAAVRDLRNSPEGLRIRRTLISGDERGLELAVTSATGGEDPLHNMDAVEAYIFEIQPKDDQGNMRLTDGQKEAARSDGELGAEAMILKYEGSLEKAIEVATRQITQSPATDPYIAAIQSEILKSLRRRLNDSGGTGLPSVSQITGN